MTLLIFGICLVYSDRDVKGWALIIGSLIIPIGNFINNRGESKVNDATMKEPEKRKNQDS
jgi:hypothetical protein